jgi:hypothetical protein
MGTERDALLRHYRSAVGDIHDVGREWRFQIASPPYERSTTLDSLKTIRGRIVDLGTILMCTPERTNPELCCAHLDAIRAALPSISLVVSPRVVCQTLLFNLYLVASQDMEPPSSLGTRL